MNYSLIALAAFVAVISAAHIGMQAPARKLTPYEQELQSMRSKCKDANECIAITNVINRLERSR